MADLCNLCKKNRKLCNAHIIPASLLRTLLEGKLPKIYPTNELSHPKKTQIGIYDSTILCSECDGKLGKLDDYGQEKLITSLPEKLLNNGYYEIDVDYSKFKLFILSILWRAHLTTNDFFSKIELNDSLSNKIREMILSGSPCNADDLSIILIRFYTPNTEENDICHILSTPTKTKDNHFYFRMADYGVLINDNGKPFYGLEEFVLKPNKKLRIRLRDFTKTPEYNVAKETNNLWNKISRG